MIVLMVILLIIGSLIKGLDLLFYKTVLEILNKAIIDGEILMHDLGYYNKSIFLNKLIPLILSLLISLLIYGIFKYISIKKEKKLQTQIKDLEDLLTRINKGNYAIDIREDDSFSLLRDEIYKIIVNLKSMEEEARTQKFNLKKDLSNIAHQLKTPITSIGLMAELMASDPKNTPIYLEKLEIELERLENFTEILLKLSKVNSNTIDYKFQELSMKELIEDIVLDLKASKEIDIKFIGEDFQLKADEIWIHEAFLNIIKNSLEHTEKTLEIEFKSNPIYKEIEIRDDGPGLDEDIINKIFDRFYRGNSSMPGYGIGLNLAKSIIEKHKGRILAYNDRGLNFQIKFYNVT